METKANRLLLDFRDNDELKAALAGKQPGDRVTLEFEVMVVDVTDESFSADIEQINTEGATEEATEEVAPDTDSPVMVVMMKKAKERAAKTKEAPASEEEDVIE